MPVSSAVTPWSASSCKSIDPSLSASSQTIPWIVEPSVTPSQLAGSWSDTSTPSAFAVTVPTLVCWPSSTAVTWVNSHVSSTFSSPSRLTSPTLYPFSRTGSGVKSSEESPGVWLSSVTATSASGTSPVLVTTYVKATWSPTSTTRPGASSASWP